MIQTNTISPENFSLVQVECLETQNPKSPFALAVDLRNMIKEEYLSRVYVRVTHNIS